MLQGWGTDFRRKIFGEDYWIKKMDDAMVLLRSQYENIIIPDVRFLNEYEWVKNEGGVMIRVERSIDYSDTHISETELDHSIFDHTIVNDGTERDLVTKVEQLKLIKQ
jgi:2-keto-4-pentenoate hydratase/2-oxohepta-3-ene-1,7-dioic acid hydratase in catechol pathway